MRYSLVLPYHDPENKKTEQFARLIRSIVRNCSSDDYEFVIVRDGPSYTESHNIGLQNAKGDYLIILNDDIEIHDPHFLEKFTVDLGGWNGSAHAWCMSRKVLETVGLFDERFKNGFNCEDTDYFYRAKLAGFPLQTIEANLTHKSNGVKYADTEINKQLFIEKWDFEP